MNTNDTTLITDQISFLRSIVYSNPDFQDVFKDTLLSVVKYVDISFRPDSLGGWNISITVDRAFGQDNGIEQQNSVLYINKISNVLISCIDHFLGAANPVHYNLIPNMFNVIITGDTSILVTI